LEEPIHLASSEVQQEAISCAFAENEKAQKSNRKK